MTINAPKLADFNLLLQIELPSEVYNTKRSSTEWFILSMFNTDYRETKKMFPRRVIVVFFS